MAVAIAALGAIALAACGDDDSGSNSDSGKPAKIAYITYTFADYQGAMEKGMKSKIAADGGSLTRFTADFDPQKQLKQCADAIQSGRYNVIVLAPIDPAGGVPCVKQADAAGIPVITLETAVGKDAAIIEPQEPGVVQSVVTDPNTNAQGASDLVKSACEGQDPCKVIAEIANTSDFLTVGALDAVKKNNANVEVVATIPTNYDPGELGKALPDALSANPDTNVFLSIADFEAIAALPFIEDAGMTAQVKVIANGGSRSGAAAVKDGSVYATLGNWPEQMGEAAGEAAVKVANGEKIENPGVDSLKLDAPFLIFKDNVDEFTPEWGAAQ